ncbi:MAG: lipid-A-disaccharide synthase [Simkaniaceae bacterium]|nr:MAG: lipid-A-disaccharide synthase [Simkaniaceae bacterium]
MSDDLFIFAGEVSGDLHGEKLLKELYSAYPNLKVRGVGGPKMRAVGMECIMPMEEFQVMGFIDILSSLPKLIKQFKTIKKDILTHPPKGVVTIDYPGFNLRLAKALCQKNSPAKRIHYICPTVWAWGKRRIPKMEHSLDCLLTILPFEPDLFSKYQIDATYVGHPLIARISHHQYDPSWNQAYGIENEQPILSIYPGSRKKELLRNLPLQIKVAKQIQKGHPDLLIAISCSDEKFLPLLEKEAGGLLIIRHEHSYELMRASHLAIATSGTVTLELALHQIPTVVTFAINPLDVFLAQHIFRINLPHYALPNILYHGELFPELFGPNLTEDALYKKGNDFMLSEYKRLECIEGCKRLKNQLGKQDASKEAARAILKLILN